MKIIMGVLLSLILIGCGKENAPEPKICPDITVTIDVNRNETMVYYGFTLSDSVYITKMVVDNYQDTIFFIDNEKWFWNAGEHGSYLVDQKGLDFYHGVIRTTIEGNFASDGECSFSKVILTDVVWQ